MKKTGVFLVLYLCCAVLFSAEEIRVLCTTLPMTIFTKAVIKDIPGYRVSQMLSPAIGCPHDYALSPADMRKLTQADVIVLNGLGMEDFLSSALKRVGRKVSVIDSSANVKGVLTSGVCNHDHGEHDHDHVHAKNEHLFAGPETAAGVVESIAAGFAAKYPGKAALFRANAKKYSAALRQIAAEYAAFGKNVPAGRRVIAVQHGIFDYLAAAAGLQVAEYLQEHSGSEPSAAELRKLIRELKEEKVSLIIAEKNYPARVTELISKETGVPVLTLPVYPENHSDNPEAYLEMFRKNLSTLKAFYRK